MRSTKPCVVLAGFLAASACAGTIRPPAASPLPQPPEAVLILPGFGYGRGGERVMRGLAPALRADGFDVYVPKYLSRGGLDDSRENLRRFIREQRLDRYARVHVFAFLAGAWTLNALAEDPALLPNLASVVYDRSPYQERAPRIAAERMGPLAWLRYGTVLFDVAKQPYPPLPRANVSVGLIVETRPTAFVRRFARTARSYGPIAFGCEALTQPHDDCIFVPLDHSAMYAQFGGTWPEVRSFIRDGRFTSAAKRTPPEDVR